MILPLLVKASRSRVNMQNIRVKSVNNLDRLSSIACTLSTFFALFVSNVQPKEYDYLKYSSFIIISIINGFFLWKILKIIISSYLE